MFRYLRYIIITTTLFLTNLSSYAYKDPFGFCSEVVAYEKQIISKYDLSPYIQAQIHNIAEEFISDCTKDEPGEIAGAAFRNVAMRRMKDMAEKFHFSRRIDLLSNIQNAQWIDLGYPEKIGTRGNYLLRTDLGFNNRYDCIVIHEVTNGMAFAHDRVIHGTQYILQEYSFYDNFHKWEKAIDILYLLMVIFYLLRNYITKITYSTLHNLTL